MRISKNAHLKRLLKTQDPLISTFAFLLAADLAWFFGQLDGLEELLDHTQFALYVLIASALVSATSIPQLHGATTRDHAGYASRFVVIIPMSLFTLEYFTGLNMVDPLVMVAYIVLFPTGIVINRLFLRWWYFKRRVEDPANYLKIVVIGAGPRARDLVETYTSMSEWGIDVIAMLDPSPEQFDVSTASGGAPGALQNIRSILSANVVDEVVVCLPRSRIDNISEIVDACEEEAVCLKFMADIYDIEADAVTLENIGQYPVISFEPIAQEQGMLLAKRTFDLMLTIPTFILLTPLFLTVALLIKLDSKGPVFFRQTRVGLNKRRFSMIKFRSMFEKADEMRIELEHLNEAEGPIFKIKDDPRVTRVGRVIRRMSIDELPQLINVVLGDMSIIGPRPMSIDDVEQFNKGVQRRRFSVRPGLACLREVSGRSELSFERWLELDLQYIREWSFWLDIKILGKLIPVVLGGKGAS